MFYHLCLDSQTIMIITNVLYSAQLNCPIDLRQLCSKITNVRYDPARFPGLIWQHRKAGGNCLVFSNGIINCNGKVSSKREGYERIRKYARLIQNCGYPVNLSDVKLLTMSMSHTLSSDLDLKRLSVDKDVIYEPQLFPSLNFKREGVHFCCFHTGKVVITGVTSSQKEDEIVCPTLIELELYTRKKE